MQVNKFLALAIVVGTVGVGVLRVGFNNWQKSELALGCPALTSDGAVDPTDTVAFWQNSPLQAPIALVDTLSSNDKKVLGATSEDKRIEIDLSDQKLTAYEGDKVFLETLISSGLFGKTTPGDYNVWYKVRATKMSGGIPGTGTYYYLPNVPYTMFFNGEIGIHGTYWHQNFGHPMSHGCVNTPTPIAEKLFYWANPQLPEGNLLVRATADNPGTRVIVHE